MGNMDIELRQDLEEYYAQYEGYDVTDFMTEAEEDHYRQRCNTILCDQCQEEISAEEKGL